MDKGFDVSSLYRESNDFTMSFCSENQNLIFRSSSSVIIVLVTVTWPDVAVQLMSRFLFGTSGFRFLFRALSRRDSPSKHLT